MIFEASPAVSRAAVAAALATVLIATVGCGGGGGSPSPTPTNTDCGSLDALCGTDPTAVSVSATTHENLTATFSQSTATVIANAGTDTYSLKLQNNTASAISIVVGVNGSNVVFPGGLNVVDNLNTLVYTQPSGAGNIPGTPTTISMAPGQSLNVTYSPPIAPSHQGRYFATAFISLDGVGNGVTLGPLTLSSH